MNTMKAVVFRGKGQIAIEDGANLPIYQFRSLALASTIWHP